MMVHLYGHVSVNILWVINHLGAAVVAFGYAFYEKRSISFLWDPSR